MLGSGRFGTRDLERAARFYDGIGEIIGARRVFERPGLIAYKGADGAMFVIGTPFEGESNAGNGNQLGPPDGP